MLLKKLKLGENKLVHTFFSLPLSTSELSVLFALPHCVSCLNLRALSCHTENRNVILTRMTRINCACESNSLEFCVLSFTLTLIKSENKSDTIAVVVVQSQSSPQSAAVSDTNSVSVGESSLARSSDNFRIKLLSSYYSS